MRDARRWTADVDVGIVAGGEVEIVRGLTEGMPVLVGR